MHHMSRLPYILIRSSSPLAITSTLGAPTFTLLRTCPYILQRQLTARTLAMATASKVKLSTTDCGEYHAPGITAESAAKASEVLQENHDNYHVFFNKSGMHSTSYPFHVCPQVPLLSSPIAFLLPLQSLHFTCYVLRGVLAVMGRLLGNMAMLFRWTWRGFWFVNVHRVLFLTIGHANVCYGTLNPRKEATVAEPLEATLTISTRGFA